MKYIRISKGLYKQISDLSMHNDLKYMSPGVTGAKVYAIGKNKKNIFTEMVQMLTFNGCAYMASMTSTDLAEAYIELAQRGTTLAGLVRLHNGFEETTRKWLLVISGNAIKKKFDVIITVTSAGITAANYYNHKIKRIRPVTLVQK